MKRAIALGLIGLVIAEMPSCGKSGGAGDMNHPNVSASPSPSDQRGKARPYIPESPKNRHIVVFQVVADPRRDVTITWRINGAGESFSASYGVWSLPKQTDNGDIATLLVENHGIGGEMTCTIFVDGKIYTPRPGSKDKAIMKRNDAGDCTAKVVVS